MRAAVLLSLALAACASDPTEPSIDHGLYGRVWTGCDTRDCHDSPSTGLLIQVGNGGPVLSTHSNDSGFYELEVEPGTYDVCTYSCTSFTVGAGELVRRDWISGPGGGEWCDGECPVVR